MVGGCARVGRALAVAGLVIAVGGGTAALLAVAEGTGTGAAGTRAVGAPGAYLAAHPLGAGFVLTEVAWWAMEVTQVIRVRRAQRHLSAPETPALRSARREWST